LSLSWARFEAVAGPASVPPAGTSFILKVAYLDAMSADTDVRVPAVHERIRPVERTSPKADLWVASADERKDAVSGPRGMTGHS